MATISKVEIKPFSEKDFWEMENLGIAPPKRCGKCKSCKICSDEGLLISCQEEEELKMIDDGIEVNNGQTKCRYPFIKDPNILSDNREAMIKRAGSMEKSLEKKGLRKAYNDEFQKFIERKVISEISKEELDSYPGPINVISHHGVLQPRSETTPYRIVYNSSQDNGGVSLNQCLPKGPNCLTDIYGNLLKFRTYEEGLVFDISKAYHTIRTGTVEKFLRIMVWRFSDNEEWKFYGYEVMAFGDRIAATALECAKRKVADLGEEIDQQAAHRLSLIVDTNNEL